jgi:hypothetical protein
MTINPSRLNKDIGRVFAVYQGMDKAYVGLVRGYHKVALNPDLTQEAKDKARESTKEEVLELKRAYFGKAKAVLDVIREEYRPKVKAKEYTTEERLLNVNLWTATMPTATVDELRGLHLEHKGDPDFERLLEAELRRREQKDANDMAIRAFRHEVDNQPYDKAFAELAKIENALKFLTTMKFYPANLKSLEHHELRNVDSDLAKHPIDDGHVFRPIFDIK